MPPLIWESRPDGLRAPALLCSFSGWNDAGEAASSALRFVGAQLGAERFARLDPDDFFDFQETRPTIRLVDGRTRAVEWPTVEMRAARAPRAPRDLIIVSGPEPSMRWRAFSNELLALAEALGVQVAVTVGALLADVPHTRPVPLVGLASDDSFIDPASLATTSYEGPTGITGVVYSAFQDAGLPSVSVWASVPHYVAAAPNPKASLALVRKIESIVGVSLDASALEAAAADYERRVSEVVAGDEDVRRFVERLEEAADAERPDPGDAEVPSGDVLAREFQRFLNQRGDAPSAGAG